MKKVIYLFLALLFISKFFGQNLDSLNLALKNAKHDTIRCAILLELGETAPEGEWLNYIDQLKSLTESKLKTTKPSLAEFAVYKKYYALALYNTGFFYQSEGNSNEALSYYEKSLKIQEEIHDKQSMGNTFNNIGGVYQNLGDNIKALNYYEKCLKIHEETNYKFGISTVVNNIAIIYQVQGDNPKALEYFTRSLKIQQQIDNKEGVATSFRNIANIYQKKGDMTKALEFYEKSLKLREEIGSKRGITNSLNSLGQIYQFMGNDSKAFDYYNRGLILAEEINDKVEMSISLNRIGSVLYGQKKYNKALAYYSKGMTVAKELAYPENIKNSAKSLAQIYKQLGDYKNAYVNYELFIKMRDSISNQETKNASLKSQLKYEYEKKAATDSILVAEEKKLTIIKFNEQENQRYFLYAVLALTILFGAFMFNRFRITKKQKIIIELKEEETKKQRDIIEEKHKEITDSINYAERIQRSFLATTENLNANLNEYFILFKPKDVVSGDFYWSANLNNGLFALVTADSTGHGVPGAIMSLLNIGGLEKAIENHTQPADILNSTRKTIIERLKKDGSPEGGKDGMDASLCVYDFANLKLTIAAANNPVWIIRNSGTEALEVLEVKPDKMPIGKHDKDSISFTQQEIDLKAGDVVYTLTDGFPDQFGGPNGKKFMSKNLRELLTGNAHLPMAEQKQLLEKTFANWVGNMEQVDDVCLIGVRV